MEDYEYHIFISYRRSDVDWVRWTRENFVRALRALLIPSVGTIKIFVDESIETGASWPLRLAQALARSRLLVPVLSRDYFQSDWCRLELALMLDREGRCGFRTEANTAGLIFPVIIDDGESFPAEVQAIQSERIHDFANPFMRPDSPKQEALADLLRSRFCPDIHHALPKVPQFDPAWASLASGHFRSSFQISIETQTTLPTLSLPKKPWAE